MSPNQPVRPTTTNAPPYSTVKATVAALGGMTTDSWTALLVAEPWEFVATNVKLPALPEVTLAMV